MKQKFEKNNYKIFFKLGSTKMQENEVNRPQ